MPSETGGKKKLKITVYVPTKCCSIKAYKIGYSHF